MEKIKLGSKVRDKVTGFEGTATARIEYMNGCIQYCVRPKVGPDGKMPEHEYIDVQELEIIKDIDGQQIDKWLKPPGGPQRDCPKH